MSEFVPAISSQPLPAAARVALADDAPSLEALFLFAREAELRVRSLRMDIDERLLTARGEESIRYETQLRHPGMARVTTLRDGSALSDDYDVWISDGRTVRTYEASTRVASERPLGRHVDGVSDGTLPLFAQQRAPITALPPGSLPDAFVHPHGLFRNILVTGPLAVVGTRDILGDVAWVVRAEHPRTAKVLVDRPDRSIEVGIGRDNGFLLSLTERVGDTVTRHAQVSRLDLDPVISDTAFELHVPDDARRLY
jgi:hypothetical protein